MQITILSRPVPNTASEGQATLIRSAMRSELLRAHGSIRLAAAAGQRSVAEIHWVMPDEPSQRAAHDALLVKCAKLLQMPHDAQPTGIAVWRFWSRDGAAATRQWSPAALCNLVTKLVLILKWVEKWGTTHVLSTLPLKAATFHDVIARGLPLTEGKVAAPLEFPLPFLGAAAAPAGAVEPVEAPAPAGAPAGDERVETMEAPSGMALDHACPHCHALAYHPCVSRNGRRTQMHAARIQAGAVTVVLRGTQPTILLPVSAPAGHSGAVSAVVAVAQPQPVQHSEQPTTPLPPPRRLIRRRS